MVQDGFMDCGLASTLLSACVWCVGDHCVEVGWGAVSGGKEEETQKEPDVSNLGIWLGSDMMNQYMKSKRWKSRFGEVNNRFSFEYVGLR